MYNIPWLRKGGKTAALTQNSLPLTWFSQKKKYIAKITWEETQITVEDLHWNQIPSIQPPTTTADCQDIIFYKIHNFFHRLWEWITGNVERLPWCYPWWSWRRAADVWNSWKSAGFFWSLHLLQINTWTKSLTRFCSWSQTTKFISIE